MSNSMRGYDEIVLLTLVMKTVMSHIVWVYQRSLCFLCTTIFLYKYGVVSPDSLQ